MKQRPFALTFLSGVFIALVVRMPLQVMFLYGHGLSEWAAILNKFTLFNWFVLCALSVNAVLVWRVSPHLKHTIPLLMGGVLVNNWIAGYYATDFSFVTTTLGTLAFSTLNLPLFDQQVVWIMKNPQRRWWIRSERRRLVVPVLIEGAQLMSLKGSTFDVSESGVFVPQVRDLGVGDWIYVRLQFDSLSQVRCQGRVVRRVDALGEYPAGVGIEFKEMSWRQRRELRRHLRRGAAELN